MSTSIKAQVAIVELGFAKIEGLLGEDGRFYVAVPQVTELFSFLKKNASRDLKALLGLDSPFLKLRTGLNSKSVNALNIDQFEAVAIELSFQGNAIARQFVRSSVGLNLASRFSDAFGIEFAKAERILWDQTRFESKSLFRELTDQIQAWTKANGICREDYRPYSNTFDCLNWELFGKSSAQIRAELGIGKSALNRDHFGRRALQNINYSQLGAANVMAITGRTPTDAVIHVVRSGCFQCPDGYRV